MVILSFTIDTILPTFVSKAASFQSDVSTYVEIKQDNDVVNLEVTVSVLSIIPELADMARSVIEEDESSPLEHVGTLIMNGSYLTTEFDVVALT